MTLTRREILAALVRTFEPLPFVYAMWEGGAAAFNRTDEWSDIDVQFDVDDARVAGHGEHLRQTDDGAGPKVNNLAGLGRGSKWVGVAGVTHKLALCVAAGGQSKKGECGGQM